MGLDRIRAGIVPSTRTWYILFFIFQFPSSLNSVNLLSTILSPVNDDITSAWVNGNQEESCIDRTLNNKTTFKQEVLQNYDGFDDVSHRVTGYPDPCREAGLSWKFEQNQPPEAFLFEMSLKLVSASLPGDGWFNNCNEGPVKLTFNFEQSAGKYSTRNFCWNYSGDAYAEGYQKVSRNVWHKKQLYVERSDSEYTIRMDDRKLTAPASWNLVEIKIWTNGWYSEAYTANHILSALDCRTILNQPLLEVDVSSPPELLIRKESDAMAIRLPISNFSTCNPIPHKFGYKFNGEVFHLPTSVSEIDSTRVLTELNENDIKNLFACDFDGSSQDTKSFTCTLQFLFYSPDGNLSESKEFSFIVNKFTAQNRDEMTLWIDWI